MRIAPIFVCAGLLAACERKQPDPAQKYEPAKAMLDAGVVTALDAGRPDAAPAADAGPKYELTGTVRGVIKLAKGAKLPMAQPILSHGVKPPSMPPCPPIDASDQKTVAQSKQTGGLSPIHIALTGMRGVPQREPMVHDVFIDACRLRPSVLGVKKGDKVRVTNRSETALVPSLPGAPFMRGLMRGESQTFDAKSVQQRVNCSFGSYCGETLVIATTHPLYDVTTAEGFFTIEHVPLDQDVVVHAWHPLFLENGATVRLTHEKPEQMVEVLLTPAPPPKPEPAAKSSENEFEGVNTRDGGAPSKSRVVIRKKSP